MIVTFTAGDEIARIASITHRELNRHIDDEILELIEKGYRGKVIIETWFSFQKFMFIGHARVFPMPQFFMGEGDHTYCEIEVTDETATLAKEARRRRRDLQEAFARKDA